MNERLSFTNVKITVFRLFFLRNEIEILWTFSVFQNLFCKKKRRKNESDTNKSFSKTHDLNNFMNRVRH